MSILNAWMILNIKIFNSNANKILLKCMNYDLLNINNISLKYMNYDQTHENNISLKCN